MNLVSFLIIGSSIILVLLLWIIVGARHLKYLVQEIDDQWELLSGKLQKRQDLIPNLIETLRDYTDKQEDLIKETIDVRVKAAKEYEPNIKKIEYEYELSDLIDKILDLGKTNLELDKDTNFLELKKEIDDLELNIMEHEKKYNSMVRSYNKHRKLLFLRPLSLVFGYKNINIFEVEI